MSDAEYDKILRALDQARAHLAENGVALGEADARIRALVNLAVRSDEPKMPGAWITPGGPQRVAGVLPGHRS